METGETVLFVQFSYSRTVFRIMKSKAVVRRENTLPIMPVPALPSLT
jgi:hypothetical protein